MNLRIRHLFTIVLIIAGLGLTACPETEEETGSCDGVECRPGQYCLSGYCVLDEVSMAECSNVVCNSTQYCAYGTCYDNPESCLFTGCPQGMECIDDVCVGDTCNCTVDANCCAFDETCFNGMCIETCSMLNCPAGRFCSNGQCIAGANPCMGVTCEYGSFCINGACIPSQYDPCEGVVCSAGQICSDGLCITLPPGDPCANVTCNSGQKCQNGVCVNIDPCANVTCNSGQKCQNGVCVNIDPCANVTCNSGQKCQNGVCVNIDPCENVKCGKGQICQNGACITIDPCANVKCSNNQYCSNGICVNSDPCANVVCEYNQYCENGLCKAIDPCANVTCATGSYCKEGKCVDKCSEVTCKSTETCKNGTCYDKCSLLTCTGGTYCAITDGNAQCISGSTEVRLRVMAANITSGNKQSYDPGEGIRIFQAFKPDVVLIQEFNYLKGSLRDMVDLAFGTDYYYCVGNGAIPNGIISKYPLIEINGEECGAWKSNQINNRDWNWAVIDLPGPKDLLAVSVHLSTDKNTSEMPKLYDQIKAKVNSGNYFVVFGGDFNTKKRANVSNQFKGIFDCTAPYPADQDGNDNTNEGRSNPYDWVLASYALDALEVPLVIGANTFPNGLVFDSRVYDPLSDVSPVQRKDSDAANMQHMAVIREFVYKYTGN